MPRHVSDDTTIAVELTLYEEIRDTRGKELAKEIVETHLYYKAGDIEEAQRIFKLLKGVHIK